MGYACPVCEEPQVDAEHLANHLAFTAILRGGPHETWLEETVPDWSERGPDDLGPVVAEHATEVDIDVEDAEAESTDTAAVDAARRRQQQGTNRLSDADKAVLAEARDLTRQMLETGDESEEDRDSETQ